ncbi:MAG: CpaF family protein, partial [Acidimicrobiales bacterium]
MSLYKRLHQVQGGGDTAAAAESPAPGGQRGRGGGGGGAAAAAAASQARGGLRRRDPVLDELRQRIHHSLIDELGPILYDSRLSEDDLRKKVHEQLHAALALERAPLSASDKAQLIQDVSDDILGYGPIDPLLRDDDVSEIMVNGPDSVYVERDGRLQKDPATFVDEAHLRRIIDKIVGQ